MHNMKMWKLISQTSLTHKPLGKPQLSQREVYPGLKIADLQGSPRPDSCLPPVLFSPHS